MLAQIRIKFFALMLAAVTLVAVSTVDATRYFLDTYSSLGTHRGSGTIFTKLNYLIYLQMDRISYSVTLHYNFFIYLQMDPISYSVTLHYNFFIYLQMDQISYSVILH